MRAYFTNLARTVFAVAAILLSELAEAAPAGRWVGSIDVPGSPIEIVVNLADTKEGWRGSIDIPAQGLSGFLLGDIRAAAETVTFAMAGVPGDPVFTVQLSQDQNSLQGELRQSGQQFPVRLTLDGAATLPAERPPATIDPGMAKLLTGRWEGILEIPGRPMRLALVFAPDPDLGVTATLDSPDEGQTGMSISRLEANDSSLVAELNYAGAKFVADIDDTGESLEGSWHQGGGSLPLTLTRVVPTSLERAAFPVADPTSVGLSRDALAQLADSIQTMVDNEELVGGELLVIKDRRTVFQQAFGWKDLESATAMEINALYCVRSMTKPLVGTAIQMLIDEGRLTLDTKVGSILPVFDQGAAAEITINHLLTHTGGLPFSTIARPLTEYQDLSDVAAEAAGRELLFEPGASFQYSDAGSDTLGAVVEAVSGISAADFIEERIIEPLGMSDSLTLLAENPSAGPRIPTAYSGGTGAWIRHWNPSDNPIFPLFLTSQSLYSTTTDYARFLAWWMDSGEINGQQLLSADAIKRALTPHQSMGSYPETFAHSEAWYGQQWMVYAQPNGDGEMQRVIFGHDGSDGTHAWAWPEEDLMVLFFTQSRGMTAGIALERTVETLLVDHSLVASANPGAESAADLSSLAGRYWVQDKPHAYYIVTPKDNRLELDRPGGRHRIFKPSDVAGRYISDARPDRWIEFVKDEHGAVEAMRVFFGTREETYPRHVVNPDLPSAAEVIDLVRSAHNAGQIKDLGTVEFVGTIEFEDRKMSGTIRTLFDGSRSRAEVDFGSARQAVVVNGERAWFSNSINGADELSGRLREQAILEQSNVLFGDWTEHFAQIEVLKRIEHNGLSLIMVALVPEESSGQTVFVDESTGELFRKDDLVLIPGVGIVGVQTLFDDYRDVGGMRLPFYSKSLFMTQQIGKVVTRIERVTTGVEVADELFAL